jgi:hypothetical protein
LEERAALLEAQQEALLHVSVCRTNCHSTAGQLSYYTAEPCNLPGEGVCTWCAALACTQHQGIVTQREVALARREQEAAALMAEIEQEWDRVRAEAAADTLRARLERHLQVRWHTETAVACPVLDSVHWPWPVREHATISCVRSTHVFAVAPVINTQDKEAEVVAMTSRLAAEAERHQKAMQDLQAAIDKARAEARAAQADGAAKVAALLKVCKTSPE